MRKPLDRDPKSSTHQQLLSQVRITNTTGMGGDLDVYTPQILSIMALGDYNPKTYQMRQILNGGFESRWVSFHQGIGDPASCICMKACAGPADPACRELGASRSHPRQHDLRPLPPPRSKHHRLHGRWLKPGPVSYKPVLAL